MMRQLFCVRARASGRWLDVSRACSDSRVSRQASSAAPLSPRRPWQLAMDWRAVPTSWKAASHAALSGKRSDRSQVCAVGTSARRSRVDMGRGCGVGRVADSRGSGPASLVPWLAAGAGTLDEADSQTARVGAASARRR